MRTPGGISDIDVPYVIVAPKVFAKSWEILDGCKVSVNNLVEIILFNKKMNANVDLPLTSIRWHTSGFIGTEYVGGVNRRSSFSEFVLLLEDEKAKLLKEPMCSLNDDMPK